MSITNESYFGVAFYVNELDLCIGANKYGDLLYQPYCERTGKKSKYWIPNKKGGFRLHPSACGDEIKVKLPEFLALPLIIEEFLMFHNITGIREIIYMEYYS